VLGKYILLIMLNNSVSDGEWCDLNRLVILNLLASEDEVLLVGGGRVVLDFHNTIVDFIGD
jgi:hypothetical protein